MNNFNILYYDLEISTFCQGFSGQDNYIISFGYAFNNDKPKVLKLTDYKERFKRDPWDDSELVKDMYKILIQADILVAHFGSRFDRKFTETRLRYYNLPSIRHIKEIDTWELARRNLKINSNRLDNIAKFFGLEQKSKTEWEWWRKAAQGKAEYVNKIAAYNIQDIIVLRQIFDKLKVYTKKLPHMGLLLHNDIKPRCPDCGSDHVKQNGYDYNLSSVRVKFFCKDCRTHFRGTKVIKKQPVETRTSKL